MDDRKEAEELAWLDFEHAELLLEITQRDMTTGYQLAKAELDIAEATFGLAKAEFDVNSAGRSESPIVNHLRAKLILASAHLARARAEFSIECDRLKQEVQRQTLRVRYQDIRHTRATARLDEPGF